jgi:DNA-binding PadR family transcriptional regulator
MISLLTWLREVADSLTEYKKVKDPQMVILSMLNNTYMLTGLEMELQANKHGYTFNIGSLYSQLRQMEREREGLITSQSLVDEEGNSKRYYSITQKGEQELQNWEGLLAE